MISPHGSVFDRTGLTPADGMILSPPLNFNNSDHHPRGHSHSHSLLTKVDIDDSHNLNPEDTSIDFREFDESMLSISPSLFTSPKLGNR